LSSLISSFSYRCCCSFFFLHFLISHLLSSWWTRSSSEWSGVKQQKKIFFGALRKHLMFCLTICNFSSLNFFSYFFVHCFLDMQFREFFLGWLWVWRCIIGVCADFFGILNLWVDSLVLLRWNWHEDVNIDVQNREGASWKGLRLLNSFIDRFLSDFQLD